MRMFFKTYCGWELKEAIKRNKSMFLFMFQIREDRFDFSNKSQAETCIFPTQSNEMVTHK